MGGGLDGRRRRAPCCARVLPFPARRPQTRRLVLGVLHSEPRLLHTLNPRLAVLQRSRAVPQGPSLPTYRAAGCLGRFASVRIVIWAVAASVRARFQTHVPLQLLARRNPSLVT